VTERGEIKSAPMFSTMNDLISVDGQIHTFATKAGDLLENDVSFRRAGRNIIGQRTGTAGFERYPETKAVDQPRL
jgi:hypothetical protein